jgi:hypothetical protein
MKVLVATRRTQGERPGDFSWTIDGELVHFPVVVCARDRRATKTGRRLGGCGCGRAFSGMNSHRSGTTAEVAELDLSRGGLRHGVGVQPPLMRMDPERGSK